MTTTRIATVAAVLLLAGMLVPVGAALPAQANPHADRAHDRADSAPADGDEEQSVAPEMQGQADAAMRGPPVDMPGNAPAFVSDIHRAINGFLDGDIAVQTMVDRITAATPGNETVAE